MSNRSFISFTDDDQIRISSVMDFVPGHPAIYCSIIFWNCSMAGFASYTKRFDWLVPSRVLKAVMWSEFGYSSIWCYPSLRSIFEKHLIALFSSSNISSSFCIWFWCLSQCNASFSSHTVWKVTVFGVFPARISPH